MNRMERARALHRTRSVRWGYIWAMWCAVFWGAWYLPGAALWETEPFVRLDISNVDTFLVAAIVITTMNAVGSLIFLLLWLGVLDKLGELVRTFRRFRKISVWFFLAAIFGGPGALFGSYLAIGYVGPIFAAVATLLYPIIGATMARLWYNEKITFRAAMGILIIVVGGLAIFLPGLTSETANATEMVWIGYFGGVMAAVGWGVEGAVAGRALDITDPDVGITIRFAAEVIYWVAMLVPFAAFYFDTPVMEIAVASLNPKALMWFALAGLTFSFCYVTWYKSFPLIGVGRGQAIGALHAVFAVIFIAIFALRLPEWNFVIGLVLTIGGVWVMASESTEVVEVVRVPAHGMDRDAAPQNHGGDDYSHLHMKGFVLRILADAAERGLWDHEIMQEVFRRYGRDSKYWKGEVRATLTDLYSGALIEELEDDLDDGRHFGKDKILMKFRISPFGVERMSETGLL
ncbi:MAG: DMT family transporter [Rhodobacteraceae bacterium]|nr:DMT family transporter [Paracoccaceae bacterium]